MPDFDIIRKTKHSESYRCIATKGQFDIDATESIEKFTGKIDIPDKWSIGVICGNSGTGKTTIAKELFPNNYIMCHDYVSECVLDDFPKNMNLKDIHKILNTVGFSSPPSWLKPYNVLSTGEKMRVDIARAIASNENLIVFDEFTSVVDRNVAQIGSAAIAKAIRKTEKQFIAVACHFDIIEWLEPDWVFDTNTMRFEVTRGRYRRPNIEISICEKRGLWDMFKKYHYLATNLNNSSKQYVGYYEGNPIVFTAVLPMIGVKNMRKEHRTVVLPDYQGVGIGSAFSDEIAKMHVENGYRYVSVTNNPAFIAKRTKSKNWVLKNYGRYSSHTGISSNKNKYNRIKTSWEYVGGDNG